MRSSLPKRFNFFLSFFFFPFSRVRSFEHTHAHTANTNMSPGLMVKHITFHIRTTDKTLSVPVSSAKRDFIAHRSQIDDRRQQENKKNCEKRNSIKRNAIGDDEKLLHRSLFERFRNFLFILCFRR